MFFWIVLKIAMLFAGNSNIHGKYGYFGKDLASALGKQSGNYKPLIKWFQTI